MARSFGSGNTDKVLIPHAYAPVDGDTFSFSFWVLVSGGAGSFRAIFRNQDGIGNVYCYVANSNKFSPMLVDTSFTPTTGTWFHGAITGTWHSSVAQTWNAYANGNNVNTWSQQALWNSSNGFSIGGDGFIQSLNGSLADFSLWTVILTPGEVSGLASGERPGHVRPASIFTWTPIDGLQSPEPDFSGRANNGTLTGTALASGPPMTLLTPRMPAFLAAAATVTHLDRFFLVM